MTRHVRQVTRTGEAPYVQPLASDRIMQLDLVLPLSNQTGLESVLKAVYDPASANYHHFLSVAQFTAQFGPSQAQYDTVVNFAKANGFTVVGGTRDGIDVQVKGPVSAVNSAFHITMGLYQHPTENRQFYAPDREPTTNLPFALWHVSGLDNFSIPRPLLAKRSDYARAHNMSASDVVSHATTGSGPSASFLGSDMRPAYYGGTTLNGAGQNLGLLEYYGTDLSDLATYFQNVGQTNNVPITLLATDGTSTSCVISTNCDDTEQTIDMTQAIGMAPALSSLVLYIGSTDTAILSAMTTHSPLPMTISCSWTWTPPDPGILDPYFERLAVQGQTFLAASGDTSTWSTSTASEPWPADDAHVVSVGGTDLTTTGAGGAWQSETAWEESGGGVSPNGITIPSWQQIPGVINTSNGGSTTLRNGPDVSANANYSYYVCANQTSCTANEYGGTSFAAPLWAAYLALVNQQAAMNGKGPVAFINPTIYAQNVTSSYGTDFHDITDGTSGSYASVPGYDLVTGWGTPNGTGLINALITSSIPVFSISASTQTVSLEQASNGTSSVTTAVSGSFNSAVSLSATGQPAGVTITFSPTSIAAPGSGSSTISITIASPTATGTYTITVTGIGGGITQTTTFLLTVTAMNAGPNPTALKFVPVTPCRVVDTRNANGPFGGPALGSGTTRSFTIPSSSCSIPSSAAAYSLNVTVVPNAQLGYLTIWPTGESQPFVSTLNSDGRIKANAAIVPAGTGGAVTVYVTDATQLILDIDGYFEQAESSSSALAFYPLTPCRVADTRGATGPLGGPYLSGGASGRSLPILSSSCSIPSSAQAYSLNITAVPHTDLGYLTVWPSGESQPIVSTLNAPTGTVVANAAVVPAGTSGNVSLYASNDTDVVIDVNGYFAAPGSNGLSWYALAPCRLLDTLSSSGLFSGAMQQTVVENCGVPPTARAYVFNATILPPNAFSYLTLWPNGETQPLVSTLNAFDGAITSNMAIVPTTNGSINAYASDPTQLILDISGYFAP